MFLSFLFKRNSRTFQVKSQKKDRCPVFKPLENKVLQNHMAIYLINRTSFTPNRGRRPFLSANGYVVFFNCDFKETLDNAPRNSDEGETWPPPLQTDQSQRYALRSRCSMLKASFHEKRFNKADLDSCNKQRIGMLTT